MCRTIVSNTALYMVKLTPNVLSASAKEHGQMKRETTGMEPGQSESPKRAPLHAGVCFLQQLSEGWQAFVEWRWVKVREAWLWSLRDSSWISLTSFPRAKLLVSSKSVTPPFLCIKVAVQYENKRNEAAHSEFSFASFLCKSLELESPNQGMEHLRDHRWFLLISTPPVVIVYF